MEEGLVHGSARCEYGSTSQIITPRREPNSFPFTRYHALTPIVVLYRFLKVEDESTRGNAFTDETCLRVRKRTCLQIDLMCLDIILTVSIITHNTP